MPPKRQAPKRKGSEEVGSSLESKISRKGPKLKSGSKPMKSVQTQASSKRGSASLKWFLKVYKGLEDWHIPIFRETKTQTGASRILYPGSDKHITASLVFPSVVYVDFNKKVEAIYTDDAVRDWVKQHKEYPGEADYKFMCENFETKFEKLSSFDLLISACAGIISTKCAQYLKQGGHFLVSDAHFDARTAFLMKEFQLVGVFDRGTGKLNIDKKELDNHFHTMQGKVITQAQVKESIEKHRNKRSFKLKKEAMFYLFSKIQ